MSKILTALQWMIDVANNSNHGYDQIYRWGEKGDYDCSSAIITACEYAGIPMKSMGATYTGNMRPVALKVGFKDITKSITLSTGKGLKAGDILLNTAHHVAMYCGDGKLVHASINELGKAKGGKPGDQTGREFYIRSYYNYPWNCILRYGEDSELSNNIKTETYDAIGVANVTTSLAVRKEPYIYSEQIGSFGSNDKIVITGKCSNGWFRCSIYDGQTGYVCGDYVSNIVADLPSGDEVIIKEYENIEEILWELMHRNIVSNEELWRSYMTNDTNVYWLCRKTIQYVRTKDYTEYADRPYTDIEEILWELGHRGIVTNVDLWREKMNSDSNIYWLCQKAVHYMRTQKKEI